MRKDSLLGKKGRDESYVLDLCDEVLERPCCRQHRFDWLVGDAGKDGRCRRLPVDGYYPTLGLVIEYRERQHDEPVPFFDRRVTVSGVRRGEQRRRYDGRRDVEIPARGLRLVVIRPSQLESDRRGRLRRRNRAADLEAVKHLLRPPK